MDKNPNEITGPEPNALFDYLRTAPAELLQAYELARLNHAAILEREIRALIEQMVAETVEATLARLMREHRKELLERNPEEITSASAERISEIVQRTSNRLSSESLQQLRHNGPPPPRNSLLSDGEVDRIRRKHKK